MNPLCAAIFGKNNWGTQRDHKHMFVHFKTFDYDMSLPFQDFWLVQQLAMAASRAPTLPQPETMQRAMAHSVATARPTMEASTTMATEIVTKHRTTLWTKNSLRSKPTFLECRAKTIQSLQRFLRLPSPATDRFQEVKMSYFKFKKFAT